MTQPVAIVTGAGSGIGRATAAALGAAGFALALVGRRPDALRAVLAELPPGSAVHPVTADLTLADEPARVVREVMARFGRLDVLINNAGLGELIPLERTTPADVERAWRVNTLAPASLILASWPHFTTRRGPDGVSGRIVNVSSMASFDPFPGFFAYASSKAALDSLTLSAANEGAAVGIKVFSVNPGAVETPMLRQSFTPEQLPPDQTLRPDAVAAVIVQCATGALDDRSGQRIPVLSSAARAWYDAWAPQQRLPGPISG